MSDAAYPGPFTPDNPVRRLPWILAIAVLLVLFILTGLGRILHPSARQPAQPRPLQARIYELPASRGSAANSPAHSRRHAQPARRHQQAAISMPRSESSSNQARQSFPAHLSKSAVHSKSSTLNWNTLQSQINSAVQQSTPSLPQTHDPHTLVARYYVASLLRKLQRIGEMNDPTSLTGMPVIKLVIGAHGELQHLTLLRSSGNHRLDRDALQIARESAPFSVFPDKLRHQAKQITLVCYMKFEGYRQLYAGY